MKTVLAEDLDEEIYIWDETAKVLPADFVKYRNRMFFIAFLGAKKARNTFHELPHFFSTRDFLTTGTYFDSMIYPGYNVHFPIAFDLPDYAWAGILKRPNPDVIAFVGGNYKSSGGEYAILESLDEIDEFKKAIEKIKARDF